MVGRLRATFEPVLDVLPNIGTIVLFLVGAWRIDSGAVTPGDLVQAASLFSILAFPMRVLGFFLEELPRAVVSVERVDAVLAAAPEGPNDLRIAALRKSGAMAARPERDAERSKRDGERAIALARELGDTDELIAALNGRGSALVDLGDVEGPVPLFEEALALSRARYGEKHENVALALAALSRTYRRAGEFARAEAAARSAVEMDREIYDGDHWVTGNHLNALAIALDVQGRIDEALPEAIESLRVAIATQGADHRETQIQRSFTAALLSRSGREAEARDLFRDDPRLFLAQAGSAVVLRPLRRGPSALEAAGASTRSPAATSSCGSSIIGAT